MLLDSMRATKKTRTHGKDHEEEWPEMVEHFREEVPPKAGVGREVW